MASLQLAVAPDESVETPSRIGPVFVDVVYARQLPGRPSGGVADLPNRVQEALRFALDDQLRGSVDLPDAALDAPISLAFLAADGTARVTKSANARDGSASLTVTLGKSDVEAIAAVEPQPEAPPASVQRRAFFVPSSDQRVPFETSTLQIAAVTIGSGGWSSLGLDQLFLSDTPITSSVQRPTDGWPQSGSVDWIATHVTIDGQFEFTLPQGAGDAWMWWLSGPRSAVGIVLDDLARTRVVRTGVPLPPFAGPATVGGEPGRVPADVTETEVADNPAVYAEDPGEFCRPFRNPERVLGERSFFVIQRVEQPVISAESSVVIDPVPTLGFSVLSDLSVFSSSTGLAPAAPRAAAAASLPPGSIVTDTPDVSFARHALPTPYVDMLRRYNRGRVEMSGTNPVQWESDVSRYQATTVARGHILEYRMRWRSNGYSLGTVAKTLTLAPRQVRRIQKIEWRRAEAVRRQESTEFAERVADTMQREREYDDSVQANLAEWSRGRSTSSVTSGAIGAGFAAGGFVIGGGGVKSKAQGESSQEGGRRTSAVEEQRLRDSIRRFGDSLRRLESIVVTEVTQEETAIGTTEVVRNQNYAHSLTVIYYQILRHLKIETSVVGVRECLFVPFPIRPFTVARAYRWRDQLRAGLREPRHQPALDFLKDVLSGFANSTVPPGRRSDQPVEYLYGSVFIRLAVDRPRDNAEGEFDAAAWARLQPFLGTPAQGIFSRLRALVEAQRDIAFQRDHAPTIAATWINSLKLEAGGVELAADFTLASRYQFNGVVRVDFAVASPAGQQAVTRELLSNIRIKATRDLSPGSVAAMQKLSFTYQTAQFERTVSASQGSGDLVDVETGIRDTAGATVGTIPDLWERQNIRAEMMTAVQGLVEHLNDHVEYYHKLIWWVMDRDRLFMLIDGFFVPGTNGVSIASVVERDPIAIVGNAIVFRVAAGAFLGLGDLDAPAKLHNHYVGQGPASEPILVSLPTDGLYAQAVMDECPALEEHFGNTDWALGEPDPELGSIAPELLASRRAEPTPTQPTPFPQTLINLQNAPEAPTPAGLAAALAAVGNANAFRDMTGLAGTQANAAAGFQAASTLASSFGAQAAALKLAEAADKAHATQTADQKLATVQRAVDKKLTTPTDAQQHASSILESLHPQPATRPDPAAVLAQPIFASASSIKAMTPEFQLEADLLSPSGGGGGGTTGGVPPWAAATELFPPAPTVSFDLTDAAMAQAFTPMTVSTTKHLCAAIVDLTGAPASPPYAGLNDQEMLFVGSLMKVAAMFAAFALRAQVQKFVDTAAANVASAAAPAVFGEIERAWKPRLRALFPTRPTTAFGTGQDISFPRLDQIFTISAAGTVDFAKAVPPMTDADLDAVGEFGTPRGLFHEWLRLTARWSNNTSASKVILAIGYHYLNGLLAHQGLFDPGASNGLWLSADYAGHDWVATAADRQANGGGQLLTQRWATAQNRRRSNVTTTASRVARLLTAMAQDKLVDATSSQEMRALMLSASSASGGIGSYAEAALDHVGRTVTHLGSKIGFGDDASSHDCAIVERSVGGKDLRYVVVGLGSLAAQQRKDLSDLFVLLDDVIVQRNP